MAESGGILIIDAEDAGTTPYEFDSLFEDGSCTLTVDAAAKNNGSYGYLMTFDGANNSIYGQVGFTEQTTIYARAYFYFPSSLSAASADTWMPLVLYDDTVALCYLRLYMATDGSMTRQRFYYLHDSGQSYEALDNGSVSSDAWHYIELRYTSGNGTGVAACRIDGVQVDGGHTDLINTGACDSIRVGQVSALVPDENDVAYFDDVKLATDDWVGAYSDAGGGSAVPVILQQM